MLLGIIGPRRLACCPTYVTALMLADDLGVLQVKKGPLAETSPMLSDISGVPTWTKVSCCACFACCASHLAEPVPRAAQAKACGLTSKVELSKGLCLHAWEVLSVHADL